MNILVFVPTRGFTRCEPRRVSGRALFSATKQDGPVPHGPRLTVFRQSLARSCGILVALICASSVDACGGCYRLPYRTVLEKLESSDRVVIAQTVSEPGTTWKIARVLKGKDLVGSTIQVGSTESRSPQVLRFTMNAWKPVSFADPEVVRFLAGGLLVSRSAKTTATIRQQAQQLRYFLPYLEHDDPIIADSTHARFSRVPYAALKEIAADLDRAKLRTWIDRHSAAINKRVALFVTLLGVCGDDRDARQIKAWLDRGYAGNEVAYLTALLTAHIELDGEMALRFIEESYIQNRDRQLGEVIAAVDALRTHAEAGTAGRRDRIKASFQLLLRERTALVELIVDDYARWEDWSIATKLIEIHAGGRQPWNNRLIMKYLEKCPLPEAEQYVQQGEREGEFKQVN